MSDETSSSPQLSGIDLGSHVELNLTATDGGKVRVTAIIHPDNGDVETIYSSSEDRDFFESRQKRGTIANEISAQSPTEADASAIRADFKQFCHKLSAKSEEVKRKLQPPTVQKLLDETQEVKVFGGDSTRVSVQLVKDGSQGTIEFSPDEFTSASPKALKSKYYNQFYERLDLTKEDWDLIADEWEEMQNEAGYEAQTPAEAAAEQVLYGLRGRITAKDKKQVLKNDTYAAWFDEGNSDNASEIPEDADVVWVRSDAVLSELENTHMNANAISELSKTLQELGFTYRGSKKVIGIRCYAFDPDALEIGEMDVHDDHQSEDPEVEP